MSECEREMAAAREVDDDSMGCRVIAQGYKVLDEERHAVDYRPSVWGDYFIKNPTLPHTYEVHIIIYIYRHTHTLAFPCIYYSKVEMMRLLYVYDTLGTYSVSNAFIFPCIFIWHALQS